MSKHTGRSHHLALEHSLGRSFNERLVPGRKWMAIFCGQLNPHALLGEGSVQAQAGNQDRKACTVQKVSPSSSTKPSGEMGSTNVIGTQSTDRPAI